MKIVSAVAEHCNGPGWSNTPVLVYYYHQQELYCEYLQPNEQTPAMRELFGVCSAANAAMVRAVETLLHQKPKLRKRFERPTKRPNAELSGDCRRGEYDRRK